jgi:hypothetical protein
MTIITVAAVDEVGTVLAEFAVIHFIAICHFITKFNVVGSKAVQRVFGIIGPVAVSTVFHPAAGKSQIAVFGMILVGCIFAVFAFAAVSHCRVGNGLEQLIELFKKRFVKIVRAPVLQWVPLVGEPKLLVKDFVGFIGGVDGNNGFATQVAFSVVKFSFITEGQPADLPAIGA